MLVSAKNPVAADIVCANLLGLNVANIPYLKTLINQTQLAVPGNLEIIGDDHPRVTLSPFRSNFTHGKIDVFVGEACSGCLAGMLSAIATSRHKDNVKRGVILNVLRSLLKRGREAYIPGKNAPQPAGNYKSINLMGECACKQFPDITGTYYHGCPPTAEEIFREQETQILNKKRMRNDDHAVN